MSPRGRAGGQVMVRGKTFGMSVTFLHSNHQCIFQLIPGLHGADGILSFVCYDFIAAMKSALDGYFSYLLYSGLGWFAILNFQCFVIFWRSFGR
ncbi:hypothetical protein WG66_007906, partial [Moniliophthora roreri]